MKSVGRLLQTTGARVFAAAVVLVGGSMLSASAGWFIPEISAEPPTGNEKAILLGVHRSTVEVFIDLPNFGIRRMMLPLEDIVTAPKFDPTTRGTEEGRLAAGEKPTGKDKPPHFAVDDMMAKRGGRIPVAKDREFLKLKSVLLVGLVTHADPVVYLAGKIPNPGDAKDPPTREPDQFEATALRGLRNGENIVAEKRGGEMRAMGPIYAGKRCAGCHKHEGELLGAFAYRYELLPGEPPTPQPRGSE